MLAAVLYGKEDLRLEHVNDPTPKSGEVVIEVDVATTCGTDLKVWRRGGHAKMLRPPTLFGHEAAGQIVALGSDVQGWKVGDRVIANNSAPCMSCFFCDRKEYSLCQNLIFNNGTFAQYQTIPAQIVQHNLHRIPEGMPTALASLTEPFACVLHGVLRSGLREKQRHGVTPNVIVIGDGAIGLMFVGAIALQGANVSLFGGSDARLDIGRQFGAQHVFNHHQIDGIESRVMDLTEGMGADIVIEATGVPQVWETAIACGRPGSTINLFGGCPKETAITVNTERLHYDELTLKGVFHNTPEIVRQSLATLARRELPYELMVNDRQPLTELEKVFQAMKARKTIKAAISPR
ncbi:MAG: alcohol dehydrogenase catalytic domain-containing protein [Cyanobacteria bacterium P01_F01_bin.42]